jgi:hypothetical protein
MQQIQQLNTFRSELIKVPSGGELTFARLAI